MKIKTVTTVNGVNPVYFGNYSSRFYWFKNLGDSTLYISSNPNMIAGGDDVSELPPKSSTAIETTAGVVYILGAGKAEIHNTDSKFCPFRGTSVVSGGGGESVKTTHFEIIETVEPITNYTADIYSYIDQDLLISCGSKSFTTPVTKGFNSILLGCTDTDGNAHISVNSEDPIIYCNKSSTVNNALSEYNIIMESTGTMFKYSDRTVSKTYADKAYIAWCLYNAWFNPVVVSTTNNGTTYKMSGTQTSALSPSADSNGGTFDALGVTWYWNASLPNSYQSVTDKSGLNRYRMQDRGTLATKEIIARELLEICMSDYLYN